MRIVAPPPSNEVKFWKLIEQANWGKDHNFKRINRFFKENLSKKELEDLRNFVNSKFIELNYRFNDLRKRHDVDWIGDDSWSDLLCEVIGRGYFFYKLITDEKIKEMINKNDYQESFYYSLFN